MIFTSPETRMTVLSDSENRMIVASFVWTKHRNVTDSETDGRTDGHICLGYAAVCIASNAIMSRREGGNSLHAPRSDSKSETGAARTGQGTQVEAVTGEQNLIVGLNLKIVERRRQAVG